MSTPQDDPAHVIRSLAELTRNRIIGQDDAVAVFALITYSHIALGPLQRRPGAFLITGPNVEEGHLDMVGGLVQSHKSMGGLYKLAGNPGEDIDQIFSSSPVATKAVSLLQALKDNPDSVFVLQDIDQTHPNLRTRFERIWSHGYIVDEAGKLCSLADAIFILTTEVAQDAIGEIARTDPDPARLHIECLKALVDAGFPPRSSDTSTSRSA
jgi:ATP-dependent Clp protease ATP-binding subunit ClpA